MEFSHKYHKKRSYEKYHDDKLLVNEILAIFRERDKDKISLTKMSQDTGIPVKVL